MAEISLRVTHNTPELRAILAQRPTRLMSAIDRAVSRGAQEVLRQARRDAPKAFTTLTNSGNVWRHGEADYSPYFGVSYASYVEEGTKGGGWPSDPTIREWIRIHGLTPRTPGVTAEDLPFLIRRKIGTKGIKAQPYLRPAFYQLRPRLVELMRAAVEQGLHP